MNENDWITFDEQLEIDKAIRFYAKEKLKTIYERHSLGKVMLKIVDINDYFKSQLKINGIKKED